MRAMPVTARSTSLPSAPSVRLRMPSPEASSLMVLTIVPSSSSTSHGSTRWLGGGTCANQNSMLLMSCTFNAVAFSQLLRGTLHLHAADANHDGAKTDAFFKLDIP